MRSFVALFRKELRSYFGSPLVYVVAAAFLAYAGYYFHSDLIYFITFGFGLNIMENFWQVLFVDIRLVLIFAIPLLTMRLLAEERRLGTLDLSLQPLPALLSGGHRPARRLLLRVRDGVLRVGDAARPGGTAMARTALSATSQRLRILLALPALVGIFGLGEAILDRRGLRLDLTPERRYTLSDHAKKILDELPADVRILAFLRSQDPRNPAILDLLRRVEGRTRRVHADVVDVNRSPALARQYDVDSYGALVVESDGRRRVFSNPREEVLMAALLQVTRQQRKIVGWVVGHGEGDLANIDRHRGFSTVRALLEQEYYEVRPVSLIGDEVPPETSVLVIAGPQKDFLPEELAAVDRYLQRPGQALVMLDPLLAA